jgi:hypothetical protein
MVAVAMYGMAYRYSGGSRQVLCASTSGRKETERCAGVERSQYDIRSDTTASERLPVIGLSLPGVLACGPVIPQKVHVQQSMRLWAYANRRSGGKATSK